MSTAVTVEFNNLEGAKLALITLADKAGPRVRTALKSELEDIRDIMRDNAKAHLTKRTTTKSDFSKGIKHFVFYRNTRDVPLDKVGGAVKAYGKMWIAHEQGAIIRADGKWLLIRNPKYLRYFGGKKQNRMPLGTYVAPLDHSNGDEMLGVYLPLKTKRILLAVMKKVVKLEARLALAELSKRRSRSVARNIANSIVWDK